MNTNVYKALVRTLTPLAITGIVSLVAHFHYHVTNATAIQIVAFGFAGLTILLHAAETKFPWVGVLMGWLGAPAYAPSKSASLQDQFNALSAEYATLLAKQQEAANPSTPSAPVSAPVVTAPPTPIIPPVTPPVG